MSNKINDLANGFQVTCGLTSPTVAIVTTGITGPAIDMLQQDGNCFAVQVVGTIVGVTATYAGKIQESPSTTAASFTDISGATFGTVTTVGTSGPHIGLLTFQRTQRYVRYVGVVGGTTSTVAADCLILGQYKQL
jgi:hypothetical protein